MAVVEPIIRQAGIDVIWFGIFIVVVVEMAQITPPIGFNLFVLQGISRHDMNYIARAALPMFLLMVVMVVLLVSFPEMATFLPETMSQPSGGSWRFSVRRISESDLFDGYNALHYCWIIGQQSRGGHALHQFAP